MSFMVRASRLIDRRILRIEDGNHGEYRPRPGEFVDDGVPYVRAADLAAGTVNFATAGRINAIARNRVNKGIGLPGDVIISHKGTVGKVAQAPNDSPDYVCSPQTTFWRSLDGGVLDPSYLRYVAEAPQFQNQLRAREAESDMAPYVSLTQQKLMFIPLPPIDDQRAIAEVLGALDDKIAANRICLQVADSLVRSKFEKLAQDADGTVLLRELADSPRDHVRPSEAQGDIPYAGLEHLPRRLMWISRLGESASVTSGKLRYQSGDVLFGKLRPYFHKVVAAPGGGICSTDILVVRAKERRLGGYVLAAAASDLAISECTTSSQGTRMPRTSWTDLSMVEVPWPGLPQAVAFSSIVESISAACLAKVTESRAAGKMRDTLLPQLMSGAIRVRDAEDVVSEVV